MRRHRIWKLILSAMMIASLSSCTGGSDAGATKAHSFNVITDIQGDSYLLSGYTGFVNSRSGAFFPGAVLIVGVEGGTELGGTQFAKGSIVIIEGTDENKTFRLARSTDNIAITSEVEVFGQTYPEGRFPIPEGGKLQP